MAARTGGNGSKVDEWVAAEDAAHLPPGSIRHSARTEWAGEQQGQQKAEALKMRMMMQEPAGVVTVVNALSRTG